jgi:hypothetical protein
VNGTPPLSQTFQLKKEFQEMARRWRELAVYASYEGKPGLPPEADNK